MNLHFWLVPSRVVLFALFLLFSGCRAGEKIGTLDLKRFVSRLVKRWRIRFLVRMPCLFLAIILLPEVMRGGRSPLTELNCKK